MTRDPTCASDCYGNDTQLDEMIDAPGAPFHDALAEALPIGIATIDSTGRQTYVNPAFAKMLGWPREELVGRLPPFAYWPADQLSAIDEAFQRTLRGDVPPGGFELCFQGRGGERIDVLVSLGPVGTDAGAPGSWVASVIDISVRAALQRAIRGSEARVREAYAREREARASAESLARHLEALQRATSELTSAVSARDVVDAVMRAGLPTLGAMRGSVALVADDQHSLEVIGAIGYSEAARAQYRQVSMDASFPLTDAVRDRRPILLSNAEARRSRYPHLRALLEENGQGAMASVPLLLRGSAIGVIGINWGEDHEFTDEEVVFLESLAHQCAQALERARLYEEESRTRRAAEEANRAKSDFLAAMSHELRTPLNGIAGYLDLLTLGLRGELTPAQRADLERIRANQVHLSSLIEDVLSFARVEAGKIEVSADVVPLDEALRAVQPMILSQMETRGIRFSYDPCPPHIAVLGDQERLVQICVNLLTNAMKATDPPGEVRLHSRWDEDWVRVVVTDTGNGIPGDKLEAIFSPFTQLGRSLNAPRAGTGLGLSISRGFAEAMGGSLTAESEVGAGSTFTLTLPRASSADGT